MQSFAQNSWIIVKKIRRNSRKSKAFRWQTCEYAKFLCDPIAKKAHIFRANASTSASPFQRCRVSGVSRWVGVIADVVTSLRSPARVRVNSANCLRITAVTILIVGIVVTYFGFCFFFCYFFCVLMQMSLWHQRLSTSSSAFSFFYGHPFPVRTSPLRSCHTVLVVRMPASTAHRLLSRHYAIPCQPSTMPLVCCSAYALFPQNDSKWTHEKQFEEAQIKQVQKY